MRRPAFRLRIDERQPLLSRRRYLVERTLAFVLALWLGLLLVFVLYQVAPRYCGSQATPTASGRRAQHRFCSGSALTRYGRFTNQLLHGSFGRTLPDGRSLTRLTWASASQSSSLVAGALLFALLLGIPLGFLSRANRVARPAVLTLVYVSIGLAPIWLPVIFSVDVGYRLHVGPFFQGYCDVFNPPRGSGCGGVGDWSHHLMLPWLALGLPFAGMYAHTTMVLLARASPSELAIAFGKRISRDFGFALGAGIIVEFILSIFGLGRMLITGLNNYDNAVSEAALAMAVILAVTFHFVVNLIGGLFEPRWRTVA